MMELPDIKEIVKDNTVKLSHYCHGKLYYNVEVNGETFQFPIHTVDTVEGSEEEEGCNPDNCGNDSCQCSSEKPKKLYTLSEDLGTTNFETEYKAMTLMRWIRKAIKNEEFIKIA